MLIKVLLERLISSDFHQIGLTGLTNCPLVITPSSFLSNLVLRLEVSYPCI